LGISISSKLIRLKIDKAEAAFLSCWDTLIKWKQRAPDATKFLNFQSDLADALFMLEETYQQLIQARDQLIASKNKVTQKYFDKRIRTLKSYQEAIRTSMDIGRSMGDAFAWFFYMKSPSLIEEHFKHPAVRHLSTGIGGRGELEFVRNVRLKGCLILYHGITTFLRIGDISILDVKTHRIVALGELKSQKSGDRAIAITMHLIGNKNCVSLFESPSPRQEEAISLSPSHTSALQDKINKQLKKQAKAMSDAIKEPKIDSELKIDQSMHIKEIDDLAATISRKRQAFQRLHDGLLLVAVRPYRSRSLSGRFLSKTPSNRIIQRLQGVEAYAVQLCEQNSSENSLRISSIEPTISLGFMPLFWCPIDSMLLRSFYFHETILMSIYNPVHLFAKLRNAGFQIEITRDDRGEKYRVSKRAGAFVAQIENFEFFLWLIQYQFFREEKVIEMIQSIATSAEKGDITANTKVQMHIARFL